ncbi:DUF2723 domain-containing protein [Halosquirtibacter xylanolyticus]|uniref:glycosyltransferase family 117 protein n=1 Tax=Halosquirtibacter xylanolyticus TaxID=3374599 RepID=UPI00374A3386|nr:DUF2723 domain-containing protein [Prolixibacteraceae bacterium]
MMNKRTNTLIGWGLFSFSLIIYLFTLSKSVSFWDCGEFLATAYKLQIGHPPGAPFYLIVARAISSISSTPQVSTLLINSVSALASAATVMFLYWTIVRVISHKKALQSKIIPIGAAIGALTFAFTDTFWFSAVEAEVYALSSFFTAVVFWSILRWRDETDTLFSRWILMIFYFIGLSIGVHLLNLLAIPAIIFIIYHHKWEINTKNSLIALALSGLLILAINYGIIPGIPWLISKLELLSVNQLNLPKHTGIISFVILFFLTFVFLNRYSISRGKATLNLITNATALVIIGYSCYATIVIRTNANPPINENAPTDMFRLQEYLNREQYGDRPLLYGNYYTAPVVGQKKGSTKYRYEKGKYIDQNGTLSPKYDDRFNTYFPRMYSARGQHPQIYQSWTGESGKWINVKQSGINQKIYRPSAIDNFTFFTTYQLGHMYFRYFMWNFVGRQNEMQGYGDILYGNWISGIPVLDYWMVGDTNKRPDATNSKKGQSTYLFLPLLLGLIGLYLQMTSSRSEGKDFTPIVLLFITTGIAIVIYLNQTPIQARERDYAYVGSFYAFAIWIGMGAYYILKKITSKNPNKSVTIIVSGLLLLVPLRLLQQNWKNHDRSDRSLAHQLAQNTLNPLEKQAILFTYGDNDTFPLWYLQEVEGQRTDIRVCNTSLLSANWYIRQMQRKVYTSTPLPIQLKRGQVAEDIREYIPIINRIKSPFPIQQLIHQWIGSKDIRTKVKTTSGNKIDYIPSKTIAIPINKAEVNSGFLHETIQNRDIKDTLFVKLKGKGIFKSDLMILNMLCHYKWDRPISFDPSALDGINLDLKPYVRFDGLTYTLIPYEFTPTEKCIGEISSDRMGKIINNYQWKQLGKSDTFWDDTSIKTLHSAKVKQAYENLIIQQLQDGNKSKAKEAFKQFEKYTMHSPKLITKEDLALVTILLKHQLKTEGQTLLFEIFDEAYQWIEYYTSLPPYLAASYDNRIPKRINILTACTQIAKEGQCEDAFQKRIDQKLEQLILQLENPQE